MTFLILLFSLVAHAERPLEPQARCVPNSDKKQGGYQCFSIMPDSVYDLAGLKDKDIILSVDGQPLKDPSEALVPFGEFAKKKFQTIEILRDGKKMTLHAREK